MAKSEDERMKAYIYRDATVLGHVGHRIIDTARGAVGKPPFWHQVRRWEIQQEAAKSLAKANRLEARAERTNAKDQMQALLAEVTRGAERATPLLLVNDRGRAADRDTGR